MGKACREENCDQCPAQLEVYKANKMITAIGGFYPLQRQMVSLIICRCRHHGSYECEENRVSDWVQSQILQSLEGPAQTSLIPSALDSQSANSQGKELRDDS